MKYLKVLSAVLLVTLFSCTTEAKNQFEGTWELISAKSTSPDTTVVTTQADFKQIKVMTKSHFVWIGQEPDRAKFLEGGTDAELLEAARTFGAGGGTYTFEGDTYTEHIEFFSNPNWVGVAIPFKFQIEGDQWIHSGTIPFKTLGLREFDVELYEVWKRIE